MSKGLNIALFAAIALVTVAAAMAFPMLDGSTDSAPEPMYAHGDMERRDIASPPPDRQCPPEQPGMMGGFRDFRPMEPRDAPPEVIIDVSDRPSESAEDMIDAYGRAYNEKREFEEYGSTVYILDRNDAADPELAGVLARIMDDRIIAEIPDSASDAKVVSANDARNTDILGFLQIMQTFVEGSGTQLETIVTQMIASRTSSGGSSYVNVSDSRGPVRIEIVSPQESDDSDEDALKNVYSEIPAKPTAAETYLRQHVFDGGSSCF